MAEEFGDNPFRALAIGSFPKVCGQAEESAIRPEDRSLFLRSVAKMPAVKPERRGFRLSECCALPVVRMKKKPEPKPIIIPGPEEVDPFLDAMRNTKPLEGKGRAIAPRPIPRQVASLREYTLEDFMAGKLEFAVSSTNEYLEGHVVGMDELIMNRLRAGGYSTEANLDLHGLNSSQAFEALRVFIRDSWLKDLRSVLIVTGRGRNSPDGQPVLRRKLQSWLIKEPFKRVVMAFCTARPHDGGPGSIYVLLRRFRKKGPVCWERQFIDDD